MVQTALLFALLLFLATQGLGSFSSRVELAALDVAPLSDEDVQLRVFTDAEDPVVGSIEIELTIFNHKETFIAHIKDEVGEHICSGKVGKLPLQCKHRTTTLKHGDNILFLSILEATTMTPVLQTTSHFFYPHETMPIYWYSPLQERQREVATVAFLALARFGWKRLRAPMEVQGIPYEQPRLTYPRPHRPAPAALGSLPHRLALAPPSVLMPSQRQQVQPALRQRGQLAWRCLLGATLGALTLVGGRSKPIGTSPLSFFTSSQSAPPASPPASRHATTPQPQLASTLPTLLSMLVGRRGLPLLAVIALRAFLTSWSGNKAVDFAQYADAYNDVAPHI